MEEHHYQKFGSRKMSVIENQTGGKLVYLPYLITQK
jgi:hypothetical protein